VLINRFQNLIVKWVYWNNIYQIKYKNKTIQIQVKFKMITQKNLKVNFKKWKKHLQIIYKKVIVNQIKIKVKKLNNFKINSCT